MLTNDEVRRTLDVIDESVHVLASEVYSGALQRMVETARTCPHARRLSVSLEEREAALAEMHRAELASTVERMATLAERATQIAQLYPEPEPPPPVSALVRSPTHLNTEVAS